MGADEPLHAAGLLPPVQTLFQETEVGLLLEDEQRRVEFVNPGFLTLFGIPGDPEAMLGSDCVRNAELAAPAFADPDGWLRGIAAAVGGGVSVHGTVLATVDGRYLERDYVPVLRDGVVSGHLWLYRDVSVRERAKAELEARRAELDRSNTLLRRTNDLLRTVATVQSLLLTTGDEQSVFDELQTAALDLTGSEFGFFGEAFVDPDTGAPYLLAHAYTDIAWDDVTRALMEEVAVTGFRFTNMDTLFGACLRSREVVLANDPAADPRAGGLPPGHPALQAFLGLPIIAGDELLGMVGLANRPGGYDEELVAWLQPFLSTCASVLLHARAERARRRSEEELREARTRAEEASAAKNLFLSRMSHELRTPLNAMLGFAQLVDMRTTDDADRTDARRIVAAGRHLLSLLDDVMDMSSIEAGRVSLDLSHVSLARLVDECLQLVDAAAAERNVTLVRPDIDSGLSVEVDPARLRQVLLNLLDNAVKYNRAGGTVEVHVRAADAMAQLEVVDSGQGVPAEGHARVFEPFERLDAASLGVPGTGLGLAVARSLVHAMGGELVLVSSRPGRTVFRVEVPLSDRDPEDDAGGDSIPADAAPVAGDVLYVEDNAMNAVLVTAVLQQLLPEVRLTVAGTGAEALELLRHNRPDLLLLDLHLPDMDGLEVLERSGLGGTVPAYVVTADATAETRRRVLTSAVEGILVKPVNPRQIADAVGGVLRRGGQSSASPESGPRGLSGSATR